MVGSVTAGRSRVGWWVLGGALAAVLALVLYTFIGTFVFGLFLYYATRPVYQRLKRHIRPPSVAVAVALFALALPALALLLYLIAVAIQELNRLAGIADLDEYVALLEPYVDVTEVVRQVQEQVATDGWGNVGAVLDVVLESLGVVLFGLLHLFIMIAIAFYLLRDDHRLSTWVRTRLGDEEGVLDAYLDAVDRDLETVFFGNILNAFVTGAVGVFVFSLVNALAPPDVAVPAPVLLGLLTGVTSLIPIVGMKLVYVPLAIYLTGRAVMVGGTELLWFPVLFFLAAFAFVDTIPDLILRPRLSGRDMHIGSVMFAYIFGPLLFGWYGLFLGPVLLVLLVQFGRIVLPELIAGERLSPDAGARPTTAAGSSGAGARGTPRAGPTVHSNERVASAPDDRRDDAAPGGATETLPNGSMEENRGAVPDESVERSTTTEADESGEETERTVEEETERTMEDESAADRSNTSERGNEPVEDDTDS